MALNIRKVTVQRSENNQNYKNFYIISIKIVFFTYIKHYVPDSFLITYLNERVLQLCPKRFYYNF